MLILLKACTTFGAAALLTGAVHIETPRWRALADELAAAHPRAAMAAQVGQLLPRRDQRS